MSEDFIKRIIDKVTQNLGYISNGHDVFAILPTEFGKSLTQLDSYI